ncbi:MAG: Uma2 family endonuclease [Fimbriimonadales bacterium]
MSTIVGAATPLAAGGRMTVDEFERIDESLDGPFELIDGKLIRKPDMDPPHVWSTERLRKRLERMLPEGWTVRDDKPLRIPDFNERRPDIAVVRGDEDTYKRVHPKPDDVMLLIEVSVSTLYRDQSEKRHVYASSNIPVYWIVNALKQQVEVYTDPGPDGYATCEVVKPGKSVRVVIDGKEVGQIAVDDFMPEPEPAADGDGA